MNALLAVDVIGSGLVMVAGAALVWFPRRYRKRAERERAARLAELDAGADEAFFEERRSLVAYPPPRSDWTWRLLGTVVFLLGAFELYGLIA